MILGDIVKNAVQLLVGCCLGLLMTSSTSQSLRVDAGAIIHRSREINRSREEITKPYSQLREEFKVDLYNHQKTLMSRDAYMNFIEPYMQEAENVLKIPHAYLESGNPELCSAYFKCLLKYNVACFHNHVRSNAERKKFLDDRGAELVAIIGRIGGTGVVQELDVPTEFEKTSELFARANAAYYKKLGFGTKALLWWFA